MKESFSFYSFTPNYVDKTEEIFVKPKSIIKNEKNIEEIVKTLLL